MSVESVLHDVPFFSNLSADQLHAIELAGGVCVNAPGSAVFREGDKADGLYVILQGEVRVFSLGDSGDEVEFVRLRQGEFFGEMGLLDGMPRSASISTIGMCEFFFLPRAAFMALLKSSGDILSELLSGFSRRLRGNNEKMFWEALQRHKQRSDMELEQHRSLSQMVAGVAHEINTPLGIVNSAASLMEEILDEETVTKLGVDEDAEMAVEDLLEAAKLIQGNISRANHLIASFKKLSVRQLSEAKERVEIGPMIEEVIDLYKIQGRVAGIIVTTEINVTGDMGAWPGYPGYLSQILMNLLQNAERYAYDGGGPVKVTLTTKTVKSEPWYRLEVRDEGRGITAEDQKKLFEPFFTTGRATGGSGLGLSIVRSLVVEGLSGTIGVDSESGQGSNFWLEFPRGNDSD